MMLAAVETVTKADPVRESRRHNPDLAAQAAARDPIHAASPLKPSDRSVYSEPRSPPGPEHPGAGGARRGGGA